MKIKNIDLSAFKVFLQRGVGGSATNEQKRVHWREAQKVMINMFIRKSYCFRKLLAPQ